MNGLQRLLRTYEYVAQKEHWCDTCFTDIFPGQTYSGHVYVTERHTIMVLKQHIFPYCPFPDEPEEFDKKEKEEILENLVKEEFQEQTNRAA